METSIFNNSENNVAGLLEKIEALEHQLQEQKKINESLKTTTLLLNYSSDYLFLIDRQFKITSYNEAFYNLIQYNLGISIYPGYPMFELIPEIDKDYYLNLYNKVLGGETIVTLKEWTNQAHSHYYFEESFKPLIDEDGVIQGILSKSSDITRRILAQEKFKQDEKHFQSVIDSTNDLIFSLNKDLTIKSANSAYLRRIKVGYNVNIEFDKLLYLKPYLYIFMVLTAKYMKKYFQGKIM